MEIQVEFKSKFITSETDKHLDLLRENLVRKIYPGYPSFDQRLYLSEEYWQYDANNRLIVPTGPWEINNNLEDLESSYTGYELDSQGRPLHPWYREMLSDPTIKTVTGKGEYWHWGPNKTVDPIIFYKDQVLLIRRRDTGDLALPGGFVDENELTLDATRREAREETGIRLYGHRPITIYQGPVADIRTTLNAWAETSALMFAIDQYFEPKAGDDAAEAMWVPIDQIVNDKVLFGSHRQLITDAIARYL